MNDDTSTSLRGYLQVLMPSIYVLSLAEQLASGRPGWALGSIYSFVFLILIYSPVLIVTVATFYIFPIRKRRNIEYFIVALVAFVGAVILPLASGLYTERECGFKPIEWNSCITASYSLKNSIFRIGYGLAFVHIIATLVALSRAQRDLTKSDSYVGTGSGL
jgi:hypothetical protein